MRRRDFISLAGGAAALSGCAQPNRLNVINWGDYIAPGTLAGFERETGVRVRYGTFENAEELLAKLLTGNSGWDIAVLPQMYVMALAELDLLHRLDPTQLPGLKNLDATFRNPPWDPQLTWSTPYLHGAAGIIHHRSLERPPRAWSGLWDPRWRGRLTMLDDAPDVFSACLMKLGYSINSTDDRQVTAARDEAIRQKPLVRAYINAEVRAQLVAGDVAVAQLWTTTSQLAIDESPDLAFVYPAEGVPLYADCMMVMRESRRAEMAHRFLDYMLRPEVAAANAMAAKAGSANRAARALLPPVWRDSPVLYPPPDVVARSEWLSTLPPAAQRLRDRLWTEIKSA